MDLPKSDDFKVLCVYLEILSLSFVVKIMWKSLGVMVYSLIEVNLV